MMVPTLPSDAVLGIIAPASPVSPIKRDIALERFLQYGFSIQLGKSVSAQYGYLSGDDELRASDLEEMFLRDDIDAIFCLRGGYGTMRLLEHINYQIIAQHPKPFVGYSDITALHIAIHQRTGMVTFHGPMVSETRKKESESSFLELFRILQGHNPLPCYQSIDHFLCLTPGCAEGKLIGGNLSLICSTLGTPFEIETTGSILLLEDVDEAPYCIDRMLTQLLLANKLQQAAGIIFTSCHKCNPPINHPSFSLEQVLLDRLSSISVPAFYGLPIGHRLPNLPIPLGCRAIIDASNGSVQMIEPSVYPH
ncbi:muramoyltetrapeptide carboxypeptidase [Seinonella peptonophila]|uniref:Muramoyltetrapeptide carboxypeptidase n=1 Tax=Seinonella peptonophila TaxID=112248 RepID=A0A1M4XII5_9BACL|nr:LD-carboxypeptidase [Seinonella peptonophila]SHE93315.1 muramoyltetrapeptide carboxypeptidase [Seinonella peptonophila]